MAQCADLGRAIGELAGVVYTRYLCDWLAYGGPVTGEHAGSDTNSAKSPNARVSRKDK